MDTKNINQCTMILTRDCNLRCNFCYAKKAGYNSSNRISLENAKTVVDFCNDARVRYIVFTGGEPLMYPDLDDLLLYIGKQDNPITTAIPTNGICLKNLDLCKKLLDEGVNYFDISIKGRDSESWVKATGYDGYSSQLQAIRNLSKLSVEFTISMVITHENVDSFCESVRNAVDNGAKSFSFTFVIDNDDSDKRGIDYLIQNNPYSLVEKFLSQIDVLSDITDDWWIEYSFPLCIYTAEQLGKLDRRLASPCQIHLQNSITVDPDMNLLPCDMYIGQSVGRLGVDFKDYSGFIKHVQQPQYTDAIEPLRRYPNEKCISCEHLKSCYGGCPILWKNYSFDELQQFKSYYND